MKTIAEATGIDIVLYKSQENDDGSLPPVQGTFVWSENTIYIDVNAGLSTTKDVGSLAKYTMLRTYGHEFTHFIEKWNPEQYNEFRKAVFDTMEKPEDLIETVLSQDSTGKMSYDDASREVVAQAMTDILEDSQFIQQLADKHTSVFETMRSKLKEFVDNLKSYFKSLARNGLREARLLKKEVGDSISYLEGIVKQFDEIAVQLLRTTRGRWRRIRLKLKRWKKLPLHLNRKRRRPPSRKYSGMQPRKNEKRLWMQSMKTWAASPGCIPRKSLHENPWNRL